jgi:MFS family permease
MSGTNLSRGILFTVTVAFWFAQYAYTPFVNPQLMTMGVTASVMGFIGGAYGFTQFVLRIPVGISSDKWRKKFFVCAGCLCAGLAALCMLVFHNPAGFLAGRALAGVASSSWVTCSVLYLSYYKSEQATRAVTMINLANQAGRMFSFLAAGLFAARFGPESAFMLSAAGGFAGFVISLFVREDKTPADRKPSTVRELLAVGGERNLLITSVMTVSVQVIAFATYSTFTANHAVAIGASASQLGFMQVAFLLPGIALSFLLSKYILQYIHAKHLVTLGFFVTVLYCISVPFTASIPMLYLAQMLAGIGNTLTFSLLMGLCVQNIPAEKRGAAMGFFQSIYGIGMTVGPLIMGLLTDRMGLRYGFFIMAGIAALSALSAALFLQKPEKARNK